MPVKHLDPTVDIIFKLLFLKNPELLRDMIEAVLDLPASLESIDVLNPEVPKSYPTDKGIALDLRLRLPNGHEVDLEMQSTSPEGTHARFWTWRPLGAGVTLNGGPASFGPEPRRNVKL